MSGQVVKKFVDDFYKLQGQQLVIAELFKEGFESLLLIADSHVNAEADADSEGRVFLLFAADQAVCLGKSFQTHQNFGLD